MAAAVEPCGEQGGRGHQAQCMRPRTQDSARVGRAQSAGNPRRSGYGTGTRQEGTSEAASLEWWAGPARGAVSSGQSLEWWAGPARGRSVPANPPPVVGGACEGRGQFDQSPSSGGRGLQGARSVPANPPGMGKPAGALSTAMVLVRARVTAAPQTGVGRAGESGARATAAPVPRQPPGPSLLSRDR